jgi:epoxyqueuosine reductase
MGKLNTSDLSTKITTKAISLGAAMAGIASIAALNQSPSNEIRQKISPHGGVGSRETDSSAGSMVGFPEGKSAVVFALAHEENRPELDWWDGNKGTEGNRILITIGDALAQWVESTCDVKTRHLPYHIEKGGIFLKDAAVLGGLGCIGKNNLLITPKFGPRIRLRALLLDLQLLPTGLKAFDPCEKCDVPCRAVCPSRAFDSVIYALHDLEMQHLPGRNGCYSRELCNKRMERDIEVGNGKVVKYCRACEFACPVGK